MANLRKVIYINEEDYSTLINGDSLVIDGTTYTYEENALYVIKNAGPPEYAETAGYATNAGTSQVAVTDASGNNIVATYEKKPLIIEVNESDDETTLEQGTYDSITQALAQDRQVILKLTADVSADNEIIYVPLNIDYPNASYSFNTIYWDTRYVASIGDDNVFNISVENFARNHMVVHIANTETITGDKTFTGSVSLGSNATATTPAATDNDTSVATTAFVHNVVNAEQVQADWNQTTTTAKDYIKNKPNIITEQQEPNNVKTINFSQSSKIDFDYGNDDHIYINSVDVSLNTIHGGKAYYNNKEIAVKDDIPTKTSELTNDSNFTTLSEVTQTIVNSAPETLDTLNELAAALGNDANFATTISTQIGQKYTKPSTGIPASDLADGVIPDEKLSSSYQTSTLENENLLLAGGDTYETAFSKIEKAILDNEETTATSLNDLNTRKIEIDDVPTKTSQLTNDSGFLTSFTETDPTVPSHVKSITQADITNWNNKLSSAPVTSINGQTGNVSINIPSIEGLASETYVNTQLENKADKNSIPVASTIIPVMDGTAAVGSSTAYARGDHKHPSDTNKIGYSDTLLINNPFVKNNRLYSNKTENGLYAANERWIVTHKLFDSEGNFLKNLRIDLFDGNYEKYNKDVLEGTYAELYIGIVEEEAIENTTKYFMTYCSGEIITSFYASHIPSSISVQAFYNAKWNTCVTNSYEDIENYSGSIYKTLTNANYIKAIKITYGGTSSSSGYGAGLTQIEWKLTRTSVQLQSVVTKYPIPQDLYGPVTAPKFIKRGGTSSQFLKADGSVDSNTYLTTHQQLKTINNQSLLGEGNITIQGGSGGDTNVIETVKVNGTALVPDTNKAVDITIPQTIYTTITKNGNTYTADKTFTELKNAINAGNEVMVLYDYHEWVPERFRLILDDEDALLFGNTVQSSENSYPVFVFFVINSDGSIEYSESDNIETAINAKYTKPSTGIPKSDLATAVQTSLGKADTAIQGVKVNGTALTPDSNKVVDINISTITFRQW